MKLLSFKDIEGFWEKTKLGKDEVAYRRSVGKESLTRFPPPTEPKHKGKLIISSPLGNAYHTKKLPSWVMWNKDEPMTLYLNVDMVMRLFGDILGYPTEEKDQAKVELFCTISEDLLKPILLKAVPRIHKNVVIKRHYKSDKFSEQMIPKVNHKFWLDNKQIQYLTEFYIGV